MKFFFILCYHKTSYLFFLDSSSSFYIDYSDLIIWMHKNILYIIIDIQKIIRIIIFNVVYRPLG